MKFYLHRKLTLLFRWKNCELGRVFRIPTVFSSRQLLLGHPAGMMLCRTAVA
jgi:hypothetical protein